MFFSAIAPTKRRARNKSEITGPPSKDYSIGRLLVDGDNRFFAADIMELFYELIRDNGGRPDIYADIRNEFLDTNEFYAPGAVYSQQNIYALLRNPHIARNEEALVKPLKNIGT